MKLKANVQTDVLIKTVTIYFCILARACIDARIFILTKEEEMFEFCHDGDTSKKARVNFTYSVALFVISLKWKTDPHVV